MSVSNYVGDYISQIVHTFTGSSELMASTFTCLNIWQPAVQWTMSVCLLSRSGNDFGSINLL